MGDLRKAILAVLESSDRYDKNRILVDRDLLLVLQAEYNIYFVEPEDTQVGVVK